MKRSKSETRTNYLLMFADMWGHKKPFHLRDMINQYKVNANVGGALVASGYIGKTYQHGYYQWKADQPTSHDVDVVINEMNKTKPVKPKNQQVAEFVEAVKTAYPHKGENLTTEQREQAAIDILGEIMRDNQHITYDLIRIEKHETKTDLLKL